MPERQVVVTCSPGHIKECVPRHPMWAPWLAIMTFPVGQMMFQLEHVLCLSPPASKSKDVYIRGEKDRLQYRGGFGKKRAWVRNNERRAMIKAWWFLGGLQRLTCNSKVARGHTSQRLHASYPSLEASQAEINTMTSTLGNRATRLRTTCKCHGQKKVPYPSCHKKPFKQNKKHDASYYFEGNKTILVICTILSAAKSYMQLQSDVASQWLLEILHLL